MAILQVGQGLTGLSPAFPVTLQQRAGTHPVSFSSIASIQLGAHLILKLGFLTSAALCPEWPSLISTKMIPSYPRLLLGAAANPFGRKQPYFWPPGLAFGPGLAADSASQADFGAQHCTRPEVTGPSTALPGPARKWCAACLQGRRPAWGSKEGPMVPLGPSQANQTHLPPKPLTLHLP